MNQPPRILIVDDDPLFRRIVTKTLTADGFQALEASSGAEGLALAQSQLPDLILLDLMMPGIDGFEFCARLRSLDTTSKTPIIMLASLDQTSAKVRGLAMGADDYVTKPFNWAELRARIKAQLRRQVTATQVKLESQLQVFLCHASNDKPTVRNLYRRLKEGGISPWMDEEALVPGQEWQEEIPKAVRNSDVVLVCLSRSSVQKSGYIQKEIRYALDAADEQPEGTIFIIPARLEDCTVPSRLRRWQWVDLFTEKGYEQLVRALHERAKAKLERLRHLITNFDTQ